MGRAALAVLQCAFAEPDWGWPGNWGLLVGRILGRPHGAAPGTGPMLLPPMLCTTSGVLCCKTWGSPGAC